MRQKVGVPLLRMTFCSLLLVSMCLLFPEARADEPMLVIWATDGRDATYTVSEIARIGFEDQETLVVVTDSGSQSFPTERIVRIEFDWDFSSVKDPTEAAKLVTAMRLFQNQPNPFSPETRIVFELPAPGQVELGIYSPDGRLVRTLVSGERPAGRQDVRWDGLDDSGRAASSGVYFYSLTAPGVAASRRMILLP